MQIIESGMIFGNYSPDRIFKIENSYLHKCAGSGIRSVEFILLKGTKKVFFIEAKSSSPKSDTSLEKYQEFLDEIANKFIHSFEILCAWYLGRMNDNGEIGTKLKTVSTIEADFIFVLVIRGHKKEWLLPLQEELNQKLHYHNSIWKSRVIVLNDEMAKKYNLIL